MIKVKGQCQIVLLIEWSSILAPSTARFSLKSITAQVRMNRIRVIFLTDRKTPLTDNYSSLLFVALGKAEPLISTPASQKFDLALLPLTLTLTIDLDLKAR